MSLITKLLNNDERDIMISLVSESQTHLQVLINIWSECILRVYIQRSSRASLTLFQNTYPVLSGRFLVSDRAIADSH